jgi:hypothetical protein
MTDLKIISKFPNFQISKLLMYPVPTDIHIFHQAGFIV